MGTRTAWLDRRGRAGKYERPRAAARLRALPATALPGASPLASPSGPRPGYTPAVRTPRPEPVGIAQAVEVVADAATAHGATASTLLLNRVRTPRRLATTCSTPPDCKRMGPPE